MTDKENSLESLLDAPAANVENRINHNKENKDDTSNYIDYPKKSTVPNGIQREIGTELLNLLKDQDCYGLFYTPLVPAYAPQVKTVDSNCLQKIEKDFHKSKVANLNSLVDNLTTLFTSISDSSNKNSIHYSEAQRLLEIVKEYYENVDKELLKTVEPISVNKMEEDQVITDEYNYLRILNPDNNGEIKEGHKIQPLIQDVKRLDFTNGHGLTVGGSYREDRRNTVVPYSYLDYGPYYSFAPVYDSGASNCTDESNRLLLGTSWLSPKLLKISADELMDSGSMNWDDTKDWDSRANELKEILNKVSEKTSEIIDPDTMECIKGYIEESLDFLERARELDEIIFDRRVDDDFGLYLANALTRDKIRESRLQEKPSNPSVETKPVNDSEKEFYSQIADKLEAMYQVLIDLYNAQYDRIGVIPNQEESYSSLGSFISQTSQEAMLKPNEKELNLAEQFRTLAVDIIKELKPQDICPTSSIRNALNMEEHLANGLPEKFVMKKTEA